MIDSVLPRIAVYLTAILTSAPWIGAQEETPSPGEPPAGGRQTDWGNGFKECQRCGSTGRITCPTCKGQGNLRKVCQKCAGKGRRPCPQCAVLDPASGRTQVTPGKVLCPACSGRGATESAPERPCFRCKGARELPCLLCIGQGTLSCPKTWYDRTCPDCGFVGKVPCPDCQGAGEGEEGSPRGAGKAEADSDLPANANAGVREEASASGERSAAAAARKEKVYSGESFLADEKAASAIWEELKKDCEENRKVFEGDSGNEIKKIRGSLTQLSRSLQEIGGEDAETAQFAQRLKETRGQIEALDRSWENLLSHFDRVKKLKERLQEKWKDLPTWSEKFQPREREAIREHLARLRSMLAIAMKHSATLKEENPERIATGVKELTASVEELRRDLQKAKGAAGSKKQAKKAVPKTGAESGSLSDRSVRPGADRGNPFVAGPEARSTVERSGEEALLTARGKESPGREEKGDSQRPASQEIKSGPPRAGKDRPSAPAGEGGDGLAIALGMLGVALCGAIYFFLHKKDGRPPIPAGRRNSD